MATLTDSTRGRRPEQEYDDSSIPDRDNPPSPGGSASEWLWELDVPLGQPTSYFDTDNTAYHHG